MPEELKSQEKNDVQEIQNPAEETGGDLVAEKQEIVLTPAQSKFKSDIIFYLEKGDFRKGFLGIDTLSSDSKRVVLNDPEVRFIAKNQVLFFLNKLLLPQVFEIIKMLDLSEEIFDDPKIREGFVNYICIYGKIEATGLPDTFVQSIAKDAMNISIKHRSISNVILIKNNFSLQEDAEIVDSVMAIFFD